MLFDPVESDSIVPDLFITHAHFDHCKGFQSPIQTKYSTKETQNSMRPIAAESPEIGNKFA